MQCTYAHMCLYAPIGSEPSGLKVGWRLAHVCRGGNTRAECYQDKVKFIQVSIETVLVAILHKTKYLLPPLHLLPLLLHVEIYTVI